MSEYFGKETPKLGFGLMRLPKKGLAIDVEQVKQMVDLFLEAGFTYFDTAYVYPGSEAAIKKALVERHPRESYTLATKLNAAMALTEKMAKNQFFTSLERTGAGYFDYYLLHALMENNYKKYDESSFLVLVVVVRHYCLLFNATVFCVSFCCCSTRKFRICRTKVICCNGTCFQSLCFECVVCIGERHFHIGNKPEV